MNEREIIDRKIVIKHQAICLIKEEIKNLRIRSSLLNLKERLEDKLNENGFDSVLSQKLDCIQYLLEN